jgi:hypothetical protein
LGGHDGVEHHIGLQDAGDHARGHLGGGIANVDLADRDVVLAPVQRSGLGQAADAVFG